MVDGIPLVFLDSQCRILRADKRIDIPRATLPRSVVLVSLPHSSTNSNSTHRLSNINMPPTQSTAVAAPTPTTSATLTHLPSVPAMVVLAFFLSMMATLAIGVALRQRKVMTAAKRKKTPAQDEPPSAPTGPSWFSRFKFPESTAISDADDPTAVGALHAASVLLAAAPCQVFSPPMTMHFRIPLEDKTIVILGVPVCSGAQCCSDLAVRFILDHKVNRWSVPDVTTLPDRLSRNIVGTAMDPPITLFQILRESPVVIIQKAPRPFSNSLPTPDGHTSAIKTVRTALT